MSRVLSSRQAEELHKSIIAYLTGNGLPNTTTVLRAELGWEEGAFDANAVKKYEKLLEKKWTSAVRLQKKIMDLETRGAIMQAELDNTSPAPISKRNQDPAAWLPQSPPRFSLKSHRDTVNCIAFHPQFSSLASGSDDCNIKIWDWEFGELERTIKAHTQSVRDLDFGGPRGGVLLASCGSDLTIKLWDPSDGYKNVRTLQGHEHGVNTVRFIPSGTLLVSASCDQTLKVWDAATGYCIHTLRAHSGWVRDVYPALDGRYLLSAGNDRTVRLWDIWLAQPENIVTLSGHENIISCCAIAPPASYQHLAVWAGLKQPPSATSTAEFMASGSRDKTIKVWDARGNCLGTLVGHNNWVSAIAFHPGGKYLLSVADDKTMRCWDLSQQGKCIKVLADAHEQFITSLRWAPAVSRDGATNGEEAHGDGGKLGTTGPSKPQIRCIIATGSMDTTIRIFAN